MSTWTMDHVDDTSSPAPGPFAAARSEERAADQGVPARPSRRRLVLVTGAWWVHGILRVLLALMLMAYGVSKVVLMQFGQADLGDALIPYGQMSPMGVLWRMVALSPLFQLLSGLAEVGAAAALLWRRTVVLGALLGFADMAFVFVLNVGYDVPVKQLSLLLAVLSLVVLAPWIPRLVRAFGSSGQVGRGPWPRLLPWRRADKIGGVVAAIVAIGAFAAGAVAAPLLMPQPEEITAAPTGVWTVQQDARPAAPQLAEDTRIQALAFGQWDYGGPSRASVRLADGEILDGSYTRSGDAVRLELRPLRQPGQSQAEWKAAEPRVFELTVTENPDGTLHLVGSGEDLVVAPDVDSRIVYDRGFSWDVRPDDPYNR